MKKTYFITILMLMALFCGGNVTLFAKATLSKNKALFEVNTNSSFCSGVRLTKTATKTINNSYWPTSKAAEYVSFPQFNAAMVIGPPSGLAIQVYTSDTSTLGNLIVTGLLGSTIKWYDAATLGIELVITTPLDNKIYYASQTVSSGEESLRLAVTVRRISAANQNFCAATVASLVSTPTSGTTTQWFESQTGGTPFTSGIALTENISTTYFANQLVTTDVSSLAESTTYIPAGVATDLDGNIYVADSNNHKIWKIKHDGVTSVFAGSTQGYADGSGTAAQFYSPTGVATDASGNVYVADSGNHRIRKITPNGDVSTFAGSDKGYTDAIGTAAQFKNPYGVATDVLGNVYVADQGNNRIRKINPDGKVSTLAGDGTSGSSDSSPAGTAAQFNSPSGVATDASGNVYVADTNNNKIRKISTAGLVSTLAGILSYGYNNGSGINAQFDTPSGVATDALGNVFVADQGNHRIRKITPSGEVSTLAGISTYGSTDGGASFAQFSSPTGVTIDASGNVYIADQGNKKIRKIAQGESNRVEVSVFVDTEKPTASNPKDIIISGCNGTFAIPDTLIVNDAKDNYSKPTVVFDNDSTPLVSGCTETTIRTYKVTDACGNFINVKQNLIRTIDTEKPMASNPADSNISGCNGIFAIPDTLIVTDAKDNCSTPTVAFDNDSTPLVSGCTETTIRTYKVTDACGNSINVTQNLIRTIDTEKPTASNPADSIILGCNGTFEKADISVVKNVLDNCSTPVVEIGSDSTPTVSGCTETTIRTYKVTDACGNSINVTQNLIRTIDTEKPTASALPDTVISGFNENFADPNPLVVTDAKDSCSTPTVTFDNDSAPTVLGSTGTIVRTYKVTDACGNSINVTQNLIRNFDILSLTPVGEPAQTISAVNAASATLADLVVSQKNVVWYGSSQDANSATNPLPITTVLTNGTIYYAVSITQNYYISNSIAVTATVIIEPDGFNASKFKLFPNPILNELTIQYSKIISEVSIFDLYGQFVYNKKINATEALIDMTSFPTGIYFVEVFLEGKTVVEKVIKE